MVRLFGRSAPVVVLMAVALHTIWAFSIWVDTAALNATSLHAIFIVTHSPNATAVTLLVASFFAGIAIWRGKPPWIFILLMPQQILLLVSAAGAFEAMWLGQFADGVLRSHYFIIADQMAALLIAAAHTIVIVSYTKRSSS